MGVWDDIASICSISYLDNGKEHKVLPSKTWGRKKTIIKQDL